MSDLEREFDLISVGDCVVDNLYYVDKDTANNDELVLDNIPKMSAFGGKGANVCIACSRLGSRNALVSKIGNDAPGRDYLKALETENININHVTLTENSSTATASIFVDPNGSIIKQKCNFSATLELAISDVDNAECVISKSRILVLALVLKSEVILHALRVAKRHNLLTVFNCSPASKFKNLDPQMFHMTDLLVVNSLEAEALLQLSVKAEESAINACRALLSLHSYSVGVIVTMGKHGCVFGSARDSKNVKTYPARMVNAVDSIGAGDAFLGALTHYLSKSAATGVPNDELLDRAIKLAIEYASLSVERKGAQPSYLHLNELEAKFH